MVKEDGGKDRIGAFGKLGPEGNPTLYLVRTAMLAAIYAALTMVLQPISYGPIQFRVAEAMTVLPWLFPEAVPGLFLGCAIANLYGGNGVLDVVFGSLATLLAALLSRRMKNPWLVPLPPVVLNGLVIGAVLSYMYDLPYWLIAAQVALGQLGACYALGMPLLQFVQRTMGRRRETENTNISTI